MQRKVLKTSNLAYRMLLAQGKIYAEKLAFYERIGCVRFARNCGKMYSPPSFSVRWIDVLVSSTLVY